MFKIGDKIRIIHSGVGNLNEIGTLVDKRKSIIWTSENCWLVRFDNDGVQAPLYIHYEDELVLYQNQDIWLNLESELQKVKLS